MTEIDLTNALYSRIRGLLHSNPFASIDLDEDEDTINIVFLLALENRFMVRVSKARDDSGFSIETTLAPAFIVPDESVDAVLSSINELNAIFIRSNFALKKKVKNRYELAHNNFIPFTRDNVISDQSLSEELLLGVRIIPESLKRFQDAIDGAEIEEEDEEEEEDGEDIWKTLERVMHNNPEEEEYVPSDNVKEKTGAMYG